MSKTFDKEEFQTIIKYNVKRLYRKTDRSHNGLRIW